MGNNPGLPPEVYGIFCSAINQETANKIANTMSIASNQNVQHVHLLFQSIGGSVSDGIFLYNLFKALPIKLTLYNAGQISSIAAVAYLGAQGRKTSASATFMLHRSTNTPQVATAANMQEIVKSLILDDERTDSILREHVTFHETLWSQLNHHDIYLSATEAVKFGLAQEIGEFSPPVGSKLFNI
jgi:ATP-dependent Clp protease, protease subunit